MTARTSRADRLRDNCIRFAAVFAALILVAASPIHAQGIPPAAPHIYKKPPSPFANRFALGVYGSYSHTVFKGAYYGACPCEFLKSGSGAAFPFGLTMNIPITEESALYLRLGKFSADIVYESARYDSLRSEKKLGDMFDDMTLSFSMTYFEVLLRLIAEEDGVRLFAGPSFGFIDKKHVVLIETEAMSGNRYTIENGELLYAKATRYGFVLGLEYAFIPIEKIYILPSFALDYGLNRISEVQPIRPLLYNVSLSIAYQF